MYLYFCTSFRVISVSLEEVKTLSLSDCYVFSYSLNALKLL